MGEEIPKARCYYRKCPVFGTTHHTSEGGGTELNLRGNF